MILSVLLDFEIMVSITFITYCLKTNYRSSGIYFNVRLKVFMHRCGQQQIKMTVKHELRVYVHVCNFTKTRFTVKPSRAN